ncbi:MAG: hypothetical protein J6Y03_05520 [Alphaproteobacteria bacterium]|nr:hypothetical protein [Alphaproteobacteria bacterium]
MSDQNKQANILLNYLSIDSCKPEFLKEIGLMDEKEVRAFEKAYRSEIDMPTSSLDLEVPISFQHLPKMIKRWPLYKEQLNFLCLAALPLQIKILETEKGYFFKGPQTFSFKNVQKQIATSKFGTEMEFRWRVYLAIILNTVDALRSEISLDQCMKDSHFIPVFRRKHKRADYLEKQLRYSLRNVGKYFLSQETVMSMLYSQNEKVTTAYSNLSKLFNNSIRMITKQEVLEKEKEVLELVKKAAVWNPVEDVKQKAFLFDWSYEWISQLSRMIENEKLKDVLGVSGRSVLEDAKWRRIFKKEEIKRLLKNNTYCYVDGMNVDFDLFGKLGLVSEEGMLAVDEIWDEYLFKLQESKQEDDFSETESVPDESIFEEEISFPLYGSKLDNILKKIDKEVHKEGFSNNFDLNTCMNILKQAAPILLLKYLQLESVVYDKDTVQDLKFERKKFPRPLPQLSNLEKISLLSSIIDATTQDLKEKGTDECLRDARITRDRLDYALEGVPEYYWLNFFVEQSNHLLRQTSNPAKANSAKVLLDDMADCFNIRGREESIVKKTNIPLCLSELKDLANIAVCLNPKWDNQEKENFLASIYDMNIASYPRFIVSSKNPNTNEEEGQNTHE